MQLIKAHQEQEDQSQNPVELAARLQSIFSENKKQPEQEMPQQQMANPMQEQPQGM
jgi:hypothetical protein